eukprot:jgi/Ulvmu1/5357/UM022_0151.1
MAAAPASAPGRPASAPGRPASAPPGNNLSYGRYWEGRTQLQQITANLSDAIRTAINFDRNALPREGATAEQIEQHKWFCDTLMHLVSLFHAVALATLRGDYNMENLVVHDSLANAPPTNAGQLQQNRPGAGAAAKAAAAKEGDAARGGDSSGLDDASDTSAHPAKSSKLSQSWAGSKSLLDYFVLRTDPERAKDIHRAMKLPVIGGLTQAEGLALGAFTTSGDTCEAVPDLDLGIHGVMLENGTYAPAPTERVHAIASWIHQTLIERIEAGGIKAAPPLQARVYATLGSAFIAFEHCQKLTDTPFPFPWVQAVNIALLLFTLCAPIAVIGFIHNPFLATVLTFMAVATYITLNEVATDIEDPFHYDPNELPLPQMQYKLNERLLAVLYSERPVAFTDVGGLTGPGNTVAVPDAVTGDVQEGGSAGAANGAAAAPNPFAGDRLAGIAQAAFAAAVADSPNPDGVPRRLGFMGRSAALQRAWPGLADLQSFSAASVPSGAPANKWRRSTTVTKRGVGVAPVAGASPGMSNEPQSATEGERSAPAAAMLPTPPAVSMDAARQQEGREQQGSESQPVGQGLNDATRAAASAWAQKGRSGAARKAVPAADATVDVKLPSTQQPPPPPPPTGAPTANVQDARPKRAAHIWRAGAAAAIAKRSTLDTAAGFSGGGTGADVTSTPSGGNKSHVSPHSAQHGLLEVIAESGSPRQHGTAQ